MNTFELPEVLRLDLHKLLRQANPSVYNFVLCTSLYGNLTTSCVEYLLASCITLFGSFDTDESQTVICEICLAALSMWQEKGIVIENPDDDLYLPMSQNERWRIAGFIFRAHIRNYFTSERTWKPDEIIPYTNIQPFTPLPGCWLDWKQFSVNDYSRFIPGHKMGSAVLRATAEPINLAVNDFHIVIAGIRHKVDIVQITSDSAPQDLANLKKSDRRNLENIFIHYNRDVPIETWDEQEVWFTHEGIPGTLPQFLPTAMKISSTYDPHELTPIINSIRSSFKEAQTLAANTGFPHAKQFLCEANASFSNFVEEWRPLPPTPHKHSLLSIVATKKPHGTTSSATYEPHGTTSNTPDEPSSNSSFVSQDADNDTYRAQKGVPRQSPESGRNSTPLSKALIPASPSPIIEITPLASPKNSETNRTRPLTRDEELASKRRGSRKQQKQLSSTALKPKKPLHLIAPEISLEDAEWRQWELEKLKHIVDEQLGADISWDKVARELGTTKLPNEIAQKYTEILEIEWTESSSTKYSKKPAIIDAKRVNFHRRDPTKRHKMHKILRARALGDKPHDMFTALHESDDGNSHIKQNNSATPLPVKPDQPERSTERRMSFLVDFHSGLTPSQTDTEEDPCSVFDMADLLGIDHKDRSIEESRFIARHRKHLQQWNSSRLKSLAQTHAPEKMERNGSTQTKIAEVLRRTDSSEKKRPKVGRRSLEFERDHALNFEDLDLINNELDAMDSDG